MADTHAIHTGCMRQQAWLLFGGKSKQCRSPLRVSFNVYRSFSSVWISVCSGHSRSLLCPSSTPLRFRVFCFLSLFSTRSLTLLLFVTLALLSPQSLSSSLCLYLGFPLSSLFSHLSSSSHFFYSPSSLLSFSPSLLLLHRGSVVGVPVSRAECAHRRG